jgi:hypothetical protein
MLRPHVGQWLRLSGFMNDSSVMGGEVFVNLGLGANGRAGWMVVYFDLAWRQHLALYKPGDTIELDVQIVADDRPEISLRHAELL